MTDFRATAQRVLDISTELLRLYDWRFELADEENTVAAVKRDKSREQVRRESLGMTAAQWNEREARLTGNLLRYGREKKAAWTDLRPALADLRSALQQPVQDMKRCLRVIDVEGPQTRLCVRVAGHKNYGDGCCMLSGMARDLDAEDAPSGSALQQPQGDPWATCEHCGGTELVARNVITGYGDTAYEQYQRIACLDCGQDNGVPFNGARNMLLRHRSGSALQQPMDDRDVLFAARNIVNQILDEAGTTVERRQTINDRCDKFAVDVITKLRSGSALAQPQRPCPYGEDESCAYHSHPDSAPQPMQDALSRAIEGLRAIAALEPHEYVMPKDWREQIDACKECERWKDHPIQRGICDEHRRPLWAREDHERAEVRAIGGRAQRIARDVPAEVTRSGSALAQPQEQESNKVMVGPDGPSQVESESEEIMNQNEMPSVAPIESPYSKLQFSLADFRCYTQHLAGRLKTMVDAAVPQGPQNKATKDVLHDVLWTEHYERVMNYADLMGRPNAQGLFEPFPFAVTSLTPPQSGE